MTMTEGWEERLTAAVLQLYAELPAEKLAEVQVMAQLEPGTFIRPASGCPNGVDGEPLWMVVSAVGFDVGAVYRPWITRGEMPGDGDE